MPELTTQLRFSFANGLPVWQLVLIGLLLAAYLGYQLWYLRGKAPTWVAFAVTGLRLLAFVLIVAFLTNPTVLLQTLQKIAVPLAVLVESQIGALAQRAQLLRSDLGAIARNSRPRFRFFHENAGLVADSTEYVVVRSAQEWAAPVAQCVQTFCQRYIGRRTGRVKDASPRRFGCARCSGDSGATSPRRAITGQALPD